MKVNGKIAKKDEKMKTVIKQDQIVFYMLDGLDKGWKLKNVPFSFYPWCIQSELSLVKHGQ